MKKLTKFILIFVLVVCRINCLMAQWKPIGPFGGVVGSIASNTGYLYAGTSSGVFLSTNN